MSSDVSSIKPRLLFSRAGYASWGLSLSSVQMCLHKQAHNFKETYRDSDIFVFDIFRIFNVNKTKCDFIRHVDCTMCLLPRTSLSQGFF